MKSKDLKNQLILLKEEAKLSLDEASLKKLNKIIHMSSMAAGSIGAGLAQVPGSDSALIVPLQINMIRQIAKEFNLSLSDSSAEIVLGTGLSTLAGRTLSQFLLGWIPLAGNVINASTAALVTEVLGWLIANQFSKDIKKGPR